MFYTEKKEKEIKELINECEHRIKNMMYTEINDIMSKYVKEIRELNNVTESNLNEIEKLKKMLYCDHENIIFTTLSEEYEYLKFKKIYVTKCSDCGKIIKRYDNQDNWMKDKLADVTEWVEKENKKLNKRRKIK